MAYTALEKMRQFNKAEFGRDVGPLQPQLYNNGKGFDLKTAALRFIHERCEGLRFDASIEEKEKKTGKYFGSSISPNQIPYNMQMDIDRLCMERALERFIDSGIAEDAYDVYYCYLEMFLGRYGNSKKMVELLSEYEANGSSLLMKHRDHYSHSVYVFALGLAIYECNATYRKAFKTFYGFDTDDKNPEESCKAANFYLEYWGLTALFHDIGYPFELPFEQVMSYFEVSHRKRGDGTFHLCYQNVDWMTLLKEQAVRRFEELYGRTFHTIMEVLAFDITKKLGKTYGFSEGYLMRQLEWKVSRPDKFSYFMDHAFFSAGRLYNELAKTMGYDTGAEEAEHPDALLPVHVDALSAILLHNSLYKFTIADNYKTGKKPRLNMNLHPLAYMLMLCDELQCWDRIAYGRNSRTELHPMSVDFSFRGNKIHAVYHYDEDENDKIKAWNSEYKKWKRTGKKDNPPRLKDYSDMAGDEKRFVSDIELIVDTKGIPLTVECDTQPISYENKHLYLSSSSFLHMHDFAVALNARYSYMGEENKVSAEQLEADFAGLSLEYKLSNINQVKVFARYLNRIRCFYTDRPVDFEELKKFTEEQVDIFAPMEHCRWVREHQNMGWRCGDDYEHVKPPRGVKAEDYTKMLREHMRCHKLAMDSNVTDEEIYAHFDTLPEKEKDKDWMPFTSMLKLIRKFDGLRIYQFSEDTF